MLLWAGRVLVTHDQKTMPRHFAAFIAAETSPGVLIIPQQLPVATARSLAVDGFSRSLVRLLLATARLGG